MSRYVNIPIEQMRDFLKIEKGWIETVQNREIVFDFSLTATPFIVVKVYTGIRQGDGQSRGCGKDAIRVCAVNTNTNAGWIKSARVYRVEGWRENLKERVTQVIADAKKRIADYQSQYARRTNYPRIHPVMSARDYRGESEVLRLESLHS